MRRIVMISQKDCGNCDQGRPKAQQLALSFGCRFAEFDVNHESSYNYDIEATPQYYLENAAGELITTCPPGNRGLRYIKETLENS